MLVWDVMVMVERKVVEGTKVVEGRSKYDG